MRVSSLFAGSSAIGQHKSLHNGKKLKRNQVFSYLKVKGFFFFVLSTTFLLVFASSSSGQVSLTSDNFGSAAQNPLSRTGWTANPAAGSDWELRTTSASSAYTWTNPAASASGGANVFTNLATNNNTKQLTYSNNISTVGYNTVVVRFGGLRSGTVPALNVLYSTDGTTYTSAGTVTLNTTWTAHSVSLPAGANGASNLRVRIEVVANSSASNFLRIDDFQIIATIAAPTQNGTIGTNEYGTHTNGANQNTNSGIVTYLNWDATNLYVGISGGGNADGHILYLDRNPVTPVNGGTNTDGTNVGFNYDNTSFAELPFRAELVAYVKTGYREYRTSNGSNGWSNATTAFGSYGETGGSPNVKEYSIPWSAVGGAPTSGFNFFCYNVNGSSSVYNTQPTENGSGTIGTGARYERYFTVTDATPITGTPPFSRNSYVFNSTSDNNTFGAISVWDFTMNTSGRQIARSNGGGNWVISGTLRVNNGTVFFGSGGSGYGTTNVTNVAITGGSLNMDQTNQALNISGNLSQTAGTFFLSGAAGGDVNISGNWTRDGGTFTNNSRAVTFNGTTAQTIGGTATTDFGFLTINNGTGGSVTLARSTNVANQLNLTNGVITTSSTNILTVTNTATTAISGGSTASHVSGPLVRNLPANLGSGTTYSFPVGKGGGYYPFTLTNPTSGVTGPVITVEAFNANSGGAAGAGISSLSTTEYWSASFTGLYTGGSVSITRPTALGTLNIIGRSATVNGTYGKLNGTVSGTSVINSDNTSSSLGFFTFGVNIPPPTITSLGSASGCQGDQLVINGTNFTGATVGNILIGGTAVSSIVSNTGTVLTVIVGSGTTGTVSVTVSGQTATSAATYTVNALPSAPGNPTSNSPQCASVGVTLTRSGSPTGGDTWYWQTSPTGVLTGNSGATFNVTSSGTYYLRAQSAAGCWSASAGSLTVVVNDVPNNATNPSPANNATNVCYAGGGAVSSVSWTTVAGATTYDVYFGAGSLPGTVTANVATTSYTTGTLSASTTYFWRVVAKNTCGDAVGATTWQFTTAATSCGLTYCTPTYSSSFSGDFVSQVTLGALSQSTASATPAYINYTTTQNAIPNLSQLGTFNLSLTFGNDANQYSGVWIDYNQNGTFETTEFLAGSLTGANGTLVIPITIPNTATLGITTIRIRGGEDSALTSSQACGASSGTTGQAQDYLINITVPAPTIVVIGNSFSFGNVQNGITSTEQSFGVSGFAFSPVSGNIVVSAPSGYQVSLTSGTGFGNSVSIPYSSSTLSNTLVYIQFAPGASNQLFNTTLTCSGGSASSVSINVFGNSYTTASILFDDFNRTDNNTVGVPSIGGTSSWSETEIAAEAFRARVESNMLRLHGCTGTTGTSGSTGSEHIMFNANGYYPTTFNSTNTTLTWKFNMRQTRPDPSGFGANTYAAAFVLGCDETNFRSASADGYAVILGNSGTSDPVRLVAFTGGLTSNTNITYIASSSTTAASNYYSVTVSLNTCTNTWSLQVRDDGSSAFADPNTGSYGAAVTGTNNTFTGIALPYFGAFWQHNSSCSDFAQFDNFNIPTGARPAVGPIAGSTSVCEGTTGLTYSIPIVTGATSYSWTVPSGWSITAGGSTNSITVTAGSAGQNGNITAQATNSCGTIGSSVPLAVSSLTNNPVSVSIVASPSSSVCSGDLVTFTATPTNGGASPSYAWTVNGSPVGTNSNTFSSSSLSNGSVVSVSLTSNISCPTGNPATSNVITLTVNPIVTPSVSIVASPSTTICAGSNITFTASPTNGGGSPSYQWLVNGIPVGTNSNSYSASNLTNGQVVTCQLTSNALCTSSATAISNSLTITVNPLVTPSVSIAVSPSNSICGGDNVTFTASPVNGGTTPSYAWTVNGAPAGTNSPTFSSTSLANGAIVQVVMTSNATCPSPATATSNSITMIVQTPVTYYQDADGDGFPNQNVSVSACTPPLGYIVAPVGDLNGDALPDWDCNDNNDDINASIEEYCNGLDDDCDGSIDEFLPIFTYWQDNDNDGFGNSAVAVTGCIQPVGYVLGAPGQSDCNDNNPNIRPNAMEVCSDGIDNDCDGNIDEGCVFNDQRVMAQLLPIGDRYDCQTTSGTLAGATPSAEATAPVTTGEDVWYYFTAVSEGVSIRCITVNSNVTLELQSDNGTSLNIENLNSGIAQINPVGNEILNYVGLSVGQTYFLCVRNVNSAQGTGTFQLCTEKLSASECDIVTSVSNPLDLCDNFKAKFTGADQYIYTFNGTTVVNGPSNGSTLLPAASIPGILPSQTYTVSIVARYDLTNGLGQAEVLTVSPASTCNLHTGHALMTLRASDACPNNVTSTQWVRGEPSACGPVIGYQWEFTRTLPSPAAPVTVNRMVNSSLFPVSTIPGVQPGFAYTVRIRPIYTGNVFGTFGSSSCMQLVGAAATNDQRSAPINLPVGLKNACTTINGTLQGATVSAQANSTATTGEDVWYSFVAPAEGISIRCITVTSNILLELQTAAGITINTENVNSGITMINPLGNEILNYVGLTVGQTYFLAVRNFNSAQGTGGFQLCAERLSSSQCDVITSPSNRLSLCGNFKARFTGASQYVYTFNGTSVVNGPTGGSTFLPLANVAGLMPNAQYSVLIDAIYNMSNGQNQSEVISVLGTSGCTLYTAPNDPMSLRTQDACPNARSLSTWIRATPTACGPVIGYEWEFTRTLPTAGSPVAVQRMVNSPFFRVGDIPSVQLGATYNVRVRPIYTGSVFGVFGSASCMVVSSTGMAQAPEEFTPEMLLRNDLSTDVKQESSIELFPNPTNGDFLQVALEGMPEGNLNMRILDGIGKVVYDQRYVIENGQLFVFLEMHQQLRSGIYLVEFRMSDGTVQTRRLAVQN